MFVDLKCVLRSKVTSFNEPVPFEYVEVEKLYTLIADAPYLDTSQQGLRM